MIIGSILKRFGDRQELCFAEQATHERDADRPAVDKPARHDDDGMACHVGQPGARPGDLDVDVNVLEYLVHFLNDQTPVPGCL